MHNRLLAAYSSINMYWSTQKKHFFLRMIQQSTQKKHTINTYTFCLDGFIFAWKLLEEDWLDKHMNREWKSWGRTDTIFLQYIDQHILQGLEGFICIYYAIMYIQI